MKKETEEQFPSLELLENKNSPKKPKKKYHAASKAAVSNQDDLLQFTPNPHLDMPLEFFRLQTKPGPSTDPKNQKNYFLNEEQLNWLSHHYPEHLGNQVEHMQKLHQEALKSGDKYVV